MLTESQLFERLNAARRVLLLEPEYQRKYPPLALSKIAAYLRERGTDFEFARRYTGQRCDLVAMTSLFTFDWSIVLNTIHRIQASDPGLPIIAGGVAASLLAGGLEHRGVEVFRGYSRALDQYVPLYAHDWKPDPEWADYSFTFTTRGCPGACNYCVVRRLEPEHWINPRWREHVFAARKPNVVICDNNILAAPRDHVRELLTLLADRQVGVMIDSAVDPKLVDDEVATLLARCRYVRWGLRFGFDRIAEDGIFQEAVTKCVRAGLQVRSNTMALILFNYLDTPREANYKMRESARLGVRPYPQRFMPLNHKWRTNLYVGKHWTPRLVYRFRVFWNIREAWRHIDFYDWVARGREPTLTDEDLAALEAR